MSNRGTEQPVLTRTCCSQHHQDTAGPAYFSPHLPISQDHRVDCAERYSNWVKEGLALQGFPPEALNMLVPEPPRQVVLMCPDILLHTKPDRMCNIATGATILKFSPHFLHSQTSLAPPRGSIGYRETRLQKNTRGPSPNVPSSTHKR